MKQTRVVIVGGGFGGLYAARNLGYAPVEVTLIDRRTGRVETPSGARQLRAKELELIVHLYEHVALTFSREKLLQLVWNYQPGLVTRTVDQTVATLRKKIEFEPDRPKFLQTVYGIGYRLVL